MKGGPANFATIQKHNLTEKGDSRVFPFSDWRFPSRAGYTGSTDTVYGVSGIRFLRMMLVVPTGTCSCGKRSYEGHMRVP